MAETAPEELGAVGVGNHCVGREARAEEELSSEQEGEQATTRETQDISGSETGTHVKFWEQGPQMLSQHLRCLRYLEKIN